MMPRDDEVCFNNSDEDKTKKYEIFRLLGSATRTLLKLEHEPEPYLKGWTQKPLRLQAAITPMLMHVFPKSLLDVPAIIIPFIICKSILQQSTAGDSGNNAHAELDPG